GTQQGAHHLPPGHLHQRVLDPLPDHTVTRVTVSPSRWRRGAFLVDAGPATAPMPCRGSSGCRPAFSLAAEPSTPAEGDSASRHPAADRPGAAPGGGGPGGGAAVLPPPSRRRKT